MFLTVLKFLKEGINQGKLTMEKFKGFYKILLKKKRIYLSPPNMSQVERKLLLNHLTLIGSIYRPRY